MKTNILVLLWAIVLVSPPSSQAEENPDLIPVEQSNAEVVLASEIKWRALNPARGDASPQAGTLWGDQTKKGESGFLVKFVDGFSSPPHIHNVTYRGIVIGGGLHNDDPDAKPMWMRTGSYWTQPAGEAHITSARGASICYVEIQAGPYLVQPPEEAFDNGQKPVNVDVSNIVWLDASVSTWLHGKTKSDSARGVQMTFLWGSPEDNQTNGTMVKLPSGFSGSIRSESSTLKIVVVEGEIKLQMDAGHQVKTLAAGSYFGATGKSSHQLTCSKECIIYVRTKGKFSVMPGPVH